MEKMNKAQIEQRITQLFLDMGGCPGIKGFYYGRDLITDLVMESQDKGKPLVEIPIVKVYYPRVAARYDTKDTRVERAIRHFIERIFLDGGNKELIDKVFSYSTSVSSGKVTNKEFCMRIADYIQTEYANEVTAQENLENKETPKPQNRRFVFKGTAVKEDNTNGC